MNLLIIILNLMQVISNIDYLVLIQVILIFLTGGIVKGLIGVGLPTVTLTLLSFLFDIKESISIILLPIILTNLYQMFNGKYLKQIVNDVKIFQFAAFLFIFPGFYFLTILKSDTILFFLGIILILNSLLGLMKYEIKFKNYTSKYFHIFIGSMTGVVTGVTGIYTMPFIFLIQSLQYSKDKVIQLMGLTFFNFNQVHCYSVRSFYFFNAFYSKINCRLFWHNRRYTELSTFFYIHCHIGSACNFYYYILEFS